MIVSTILFKLKEKSDENFSLVEEKLMSMKGKIAQLKDIKVNANLRNSPADFDMIMIAEYESLKDFDEYAAHPVHVEVGKFVLNLCEQTASVLYTK